METNKTTRRPRWAAWKRASIEAGVKTLDARRELLAASRSGDAQRIAEARREVENRAAAEEEVASWSRMDNWRD